MNGLISLLPYGFGITLVILVLRRRDSKLSSDVLWASVRTTLQLLFLGFALEVIFKRGEFIVGLFVSLLMTMNSSLHVLFRSQFNRKKNQKKLEIFGIIFLSHLLALWPVAFFLSWDQNRDWMLPMNLLPIVGMILGNAMSGVSVAVNFFRESFFEKKNEILSLLSLGAREEEALRPFFYRALKAGITPQINSMLAMGIVSIPGMMAGQLVAKAQALEASVFQIKLMLSLMMGTTLCIFIVLKILQKKFFLPSGELCLEL